MPLARLVLSAAVLLALLVPTVSSVTHAQEAAGSPTKKSSQPEQPATGPGGAETVFPAARATKYGPASEGFWIWEPTTASAEDAPVAPGVFPLIVHIHGCCPEGSPPIPEELDAWMKHLARQGYVIVAPIYQYGSILEDVPPVLREALSELEQPGHAKIDRERTAVIGYSYGGVPAVHYAATAAAEGLPVPEAIFLLAPCAENGYCLDLPEELPSLPAGAKAIVLAFRDDFDIGPVEPTLVWQTLTSLPPEDRDFVTMSSDFHGTPPIQAYHLTPHAVELDAEVQYGELDAADYYGVWKLADALFGCVFAGTWCEYALGDTPEQRFMGVWSDGVPVKELEVTDDPGSP
jgi:acetyl esterase/lipase